MYRSSVIALSTAARDAGRPTSNGIVTCGKITTSRSANTGRRSATVKISLSRRRVGRRAEGRGFSGRVLKAEGLSKTKPAIAQRTKARREVRRAFRFVFCLLPSAHSRFLLLPLRRDLEERRRTVNHRALRDLHLFHVFTRRQIEHHVGENLFDDGAQSARTGAALQRLLRDGSQRGLIEAELHLVEPEPLRVLLCERVLWLLENADECFLVEVLEGNDHG